MANPSAPTMHGAISHPRVQLIMNYQVALARGDREEAKRVFHPDVRYSVPGNNSLSGEYTGGDAVMGYLGTLMEISQGSFSISDMTWLVAGDDVALATRNHATLNGTSLSWDELIFFEFRDGLKWRIRLLQADQSAVDTFFGGV
jgi:uncharacterized protein